MRILVYPHAMEVGGSQLNAIALAGAVRDRGHEVVVCGEPGPLVDRIRALGLEHLPVPAARRRPSPAVAVRLRRLVRCRGLDIVHGYEWPPGLEAAAATYPGGRAAAVCTVMSMAVAPFLPDSLPLVVGTEALRDHTARRRRGPVHLIEPPVDVDADHPGYPVGDFLTRYGLADPVPAGTALRLVVVCRLVPELKLEGILTAVDVVGALATRTPLRLVVVGDGPARQLVADRAAAANARAGYRAVTLTGELLDPRPAYAAADVVLGMGGSALRALAFGRPLVVQGERGFWALLDPESCPVFLRQGWYGLGDGHGGAERLTAILQRLAADPGLRGALSAYGRRLAVERFSLRRAARVQEDIYRTALDARRGAVTLAADGLRAAAGLAGHKLRGRYARLRGAEVRDDFNAARLAGAPMAGRS